MTDPYSTEGNPYTEPPPGGRPYGNQPYGGPPQGYQPYGAGGGPQYGYQPYGGQPPYGHPDGGQGFPPQQPQNTNKTLSVISIVCGAIAFLFIPILFGVAGLILGGIAMSKKEKLAPVALAVSGAGLIVGIVLGAIVGASNF